MSEKNAERINVLTETENKSFIHAVVNAVTKGYADNTILEDIMDLVRRKEISKGVLLSSPDAIRNYGDSFSTSLHFLAESIEQLEIIDEPTITIKKQEGPEKIETNVVETEMEKLDNPKNVEEEKEDSNEKKEEPKEKTSSIQKFSKLIISEDWDKYSYDEKRNVLSGVILLNFNNDMNIYKQANKIVLADEDINIILSNIYNYCKTEYKKLKAELNPCIFKSNMRFIDLRKGEAQIDYEIEGAF